MVPRLPEHDVMTLPFHVQRIDHVVLRVRDLERSSHFYRTVLGCEIARQREDLGLIHLRAGASMIDLVSVDGRLGVRGGAAAGTQGRNVDHLCLRVDPFDPTRLTAHLQSHGLAPTTAEVNFGAEGDGLSLYFTDPDGNTIELKGPAAPAVAVA